MGVAENQLQTSIEQLLPFIGQGRVIPIVGPDLDLIEVEGRKVPLDRYLAERLIAPLGIDRTRLPKDFGIDDVVAAYLDRRMPAELIYSNIQAIMSGLKVEPPQALFDLARVRGFKLFVTTNFDELLKAALIRERGGEVLSLAYAGNEKVDLPQPVDELKQTVVYHLFGRISAMANEYAVTEEDTLEFMCQLLSEGKRPKRLFDALREQHLLLVGGNFSDWLARFFIRTARSVRPSHQINGMQYVADRRAAADRGFVVFLERFSRRTVMLPSLDGAEFCGALAEAWEKQHGKAPAAAAEPEMPRGAVFISYASEDRAAALRIKEALDSIQVRAWLDRKQLEAGDAYAEVIARRVEQCGFFMPIISQHTQTQEPRFFRKEWKWAVGRAEEFDPSDRFLLPVSIDGTAPQAERLPQEFRAVQWTAATDGALAGDALAQLRRVLERARQS